MSEASDLKNPEGSNSDIRQLILSARKEPEVVARVVDGKTESLGISVVKRLPDAAYWRVRDDEGWRPEEHLFMLLPPTEDSEMRDFLLVAPEMEELFRTDERLANLAHLYMLAFAVDARGGVKWWAVNATSSNSWPKSARDIMERLKNEWGMVKSDCGSKLYKFRRPDGDLGEPKWPLDSVEDWLEKAFKGKVIESPDHPVVKELQGRV
jgi:hypothetical protein